MSERTLIDHGQRIAELERKVSELYKRLGSEEPTGFRSDSRVTEPAASGFSEPAAAGPVDDPRVTELIGRGKTIQAIKVYRELTGVGLAEAKSAVDQLARAYGADR